jgi:transmembrane sensor
MDQSERISFLFERFCDKTSSLQETEELFALIADPANDDAVKEFMRSQNDQLTEREINWDWEYMRLRALKAQPARPAVHRVHFLKTAWFRYAAAILIILGIGGYLWNINQKEKQPTYTKASAGREEILPGSEKAILTLSDGKKIELSHSISETINDGTLSIENNNGNLSYRHPGAPQANPGSLHTDAAYNTMSTPRGGQYKLTLSDGSNVWLNAASSITYPITFTEKNREVTITGEAYFEIASNKSKPFIVKTISDKIEVLGTSFNINSYDVNIKTSLITGSVKIKPAFAKASAGEVILKPGEAYSNGKTIKTNIENDIAWKNGLFAFNEADMQTVMNELSRWYDIEVSYEGKIPDRKFNGKIGRQLTLAQVLKGLSATRINYRIENNKRIIFLP